MRLFSLLLLIVLAPAPALFAQGRTGVGVQVGDLTGLALKVGPTGRAYDFAVAWDFEAESIAIQGHVLLDQPVLSRTGSGRLQWFYGPGGFLALNGDAGNDDVVAGLSFNVGLSYVPTSAFELFGALTPRLLVTPAGDADLGAALGMRFYL